MANKYVKQGLVPVDLEPDGVITLAKDTSSTYALFIHSPVLAIVSQGAGGEFQSSAASGNMTGSVIALYDSTGAPVSSLAADAAGTVTATCREYQRFKITCDDTNIGASNVDIGMTYDLTAEGGTVASTTTLGSTYSTRQIDGNTESASDGPLKITKIVPRQDNDGGVIGTEVYCVINPTHFTLAG
jgi:hypothetical protein